MCTWRSLVGNRASSWSGRLGWLLVALAFLAGCDRDRNDSDPTLAAFDSCGNFERHVKQRAETQMRAWMDQIIDDSGRDSYVALEDRATTPPAPAAAGGGAEDYTTTNTQERGVDEPDFVKNDGSRIFLLRGNELVALAAWPPRATRIVATLPIEGEAAEMFLDGDRLLVISRVSLRDVFAAVGLTWPAAYFGDWGVGASWRFAGPMPCAAYVPCVSYDGLKVTTVAAGGSRLAVEHEQWIEGAYVGARRNDGAARIISTSRLRGPELSYWPEEAVDWWDRRALRAALERLERENAERIRESRLEDWLPRVIERRPGEALRLVSIGCGDCYAASVPMRLGLTLVTLFERPRFDQPAKRTGLVAMVDEVYASRERLCLATRHYGRESLVRATEEELTYLHEFALGAGAAAGYLGSGAVPGHLADPFSIDEEQGDLRVATTRAPWDAARSSNDLFVLRLEDGRLVRRGEIRGIARGERLYAARFDGPRGYLVTFRVIDPFFTLDLHDGTQPRLVGELKVPGYSTYLHPLGPDHVLTIGREVAGGGPRVEGLKLALFDVRDFAHPALLDDLVVGAGAASSDAEWDHKAFNYFASRGLLAIPFSDSDSGGWPAPFRSTLELFRVSTARGISRFGSIDHSDLAEGADGRLPRGLRRGVMMDDYVYSISWNGVKVHALSDLDRAIVTIPLP